MKKELELLMVGSILMTTVFAQKPNLDHENKTAKEINTEIENQIKHVNEVKELEEQRKTANSIKTKVTKHVKVAKSSKVVKDTIAEVKKVKDITLDSAIKYKASNDTVVVAQAAKLKKDGTADMRFKANKKASATKKKAIKLKKISTTDIRYKAAKEAVKVKDEVKKG